MPREHRVTHPVIGPATWQQIQAAADKIRKTGVKVCSWCFCKGDKVSRTRCGSRDCHEQIWQVQSWARCRRVAIKAHRYCELCPARASEVDHIIPVSLGGLGDQSNLRGLCKDCHKKESARLKQLGKAYKAIRGVC